MFNHFTRYAMRWRWPSAIAIATLLGLLLALLSNGEFDWLSDAALAVSALIGLLIVIRSGRRPHARRG